jgi:prepilin-type N-terminal cleavage/methylation domain-containing protein
VQVKAARKHGKRFAEQRGFTLVEMLMATAIVIVGLVAVAQLVPASVMLSSNNRNDGTALVFGQKVLEAMREQPLTATSYSDPNGIVCPLSQVCQLGNPALNTVQGSPWTTFQNYPIIDFTASPVAGYNFTYTDPNDPEGTTTDVRWAVVMKTNPSSGVPVSRRIILGVFRRGMRSLTYPVTIDVMLEK